MECPICRQTIKDNVTFCTKCGKKIPRCPTCGKVITKKVKFCKYDGTPFTAELLSLLPDTAQYFCLQCGRPVREGEQFCELCRAGEPGVKEGKAGSKTKQKKPRQKNTAQNDSEKQDTEKKNKSLLPVLLALLGILLVAVIGTGAYIAITGGLSSAQPTSKSGGDLSDDFSLSGRGSSEGSPEEQPAETGKTNALKEGQDQLGKSGQSGDSEKTAEEGEGYTEEETNPAAPLEVEHTYEIFAADVSWQEARDACQEKGGYLATITSYEEYEEICSLAEKSGLTYLWLGASLHSNSDEWEDDSWITGEEWTLFDLWYPGEPSKEDIDGTKEYYLCLWNAKYNGSDIGWTLNDQRNDIVGALPTVAGRVGYVCEYETAVR